MEEIQEKEANEMEFMTVTHKRKKTHVLDSLP